MTWRGGCYALPQPPYLSSASLITKYLPTQLTPRNRQIENLSTAQTWADTITDPFYHPSSTPTSTSTSTGLGGGGGVPLCLGNGTAWFLDEWVLGRPGAKPDSERTALPLFDNVTFSGVEASSRRGDRRFDLGDPEADFWNMTQAGTGKPVAVADLRARNSFVVYSPEGLGWVPLPPPPLAVPGGMSHRGG